MTEEKTMEEQMYGKVRYKRLISNNFCNEEFEVEVPVRADKVIEKLHEFEVEGVKFVDRALVRHKDYMNKKDRVFYGHEDEEDSENEDEDDNIDPLRCEECESLNVVDTRRDENGALHGMCGDCGHDTDFGYLYEKENT